MPLWKFYKLHDINPIFTLRESSYPNFSYLNESVM